MQWHTPVVLPATWGSQRLKAGSREQGDKAGTHCVHRRRQESPSPSSVSCILEKLQAGSGIWCELLSKSAKNRTRTRALVSVLGCLASHHLSLLSFSDVNSVWSYNPGQILIFLYHTPAIQMFLASGYFHVLEINKPLQINVILTSWWDLLKFPVYYTWLSLCNLHATNYIQLAPIFRL